MDIYLQLGGGLINRLICERGEELTVVNLRNLYRRSGSRCLGLEVWV